MKFCPQRNIKIILPNLDTGQHLSLNMKGVIFMDSTLLKWKRYVDSIGGRYARIYNIDPDDIKQDCWLELISDSKIDSRKDWPINSIKRGAVHSVRRKFAKKRQYSFAAVDVDDVDVADDSMISDPVFKVTLGRVISSVKKDQAESFILHNLYGYSFKEISAMTGVSLDKVRRGHEKVRDMLRDAVK